MKKKYFGTDGIRGKVGTNPILPDWILKLGWAFGRILQKNDEQNFANDASLINTNVNNEKSNNQLAQNILDNNTKDEQNNFLLTSENATDKINQSNFEGKNANIKNVSLPRKKVLIGKDTRISGYMFESALESGLLASGLDINLLGPMPTPAIAYLTRTLQASAGIVISASHNKFSDNGIKFINSEGYKLNDSMELAIESLMDQPITIAKPDTIGKASRVHDAEGRYIEFCKSTFPTKANLNLSGFKIVLDCANGATYHVAPKVFSELGAEVITIAANPDGININSNCGSTHPQSLVDTVVKHNADLGIAFDGDGDRSLMVDHTGAIVDGDEMLFIIAKWYRDNDLLDGGVVGTQMTNLGLEQAFAKNDIAFTRSKVGDRYVLEEMLKRGWNLGGETSGHIICLDHNTTGDGIVSALQVLAACKTYNKNLLQLKQQMQKLPQVLLNVPCDNPSTLVLDQKIKDHIQEVEQDFQNEGRVLLRPSGTEPLIRIMVEGKNLEQIKMIAEGIKEVVCSCSLLAKA